nr:hypothetical protein [Tanacetum cinerariifolium]
MHSKGKKTKNFFRKGMITKDMFKWKKADEKYDEKKQYKAFSDTMKSEFKKGNESKKMKDLEMNYSEETARKWKLDFPKENEGNTHDIIRMRVRFDAKMLSYEINNHHENISKEAAKFAKRNNDKKKREALIFEAIKTKKQKKTLKELQVSYDDQDFWKNSCSSINVLVS